MVGRGGIVSACTFYLCERNVVSCVLDTYVGSTSAAIIYDAKECLILWRRTFDLRTMDQCSVKIKGKNVYTPLVNMS